MKILSSSQVRELDSRTISSGLVPGFELMDRAGRGAAAEILDFRRSFHPGAKTVVVLAGKGNNGGDGYVVARELSKAGLSVKVLMTARTEDVKGDAARHLDLVPRKVVCEFREKPSPGDFPPASIVVDALLGTGLAGAPSGKTAEWIIAANSCGRPIVSLDVPSGLDSDSGEAYFPCVRADMTVTFGAPKRGLFFADGLLNTGILRFVDIGIPRRFIEGCESELQTLTSAEADVLIPRHPQNCNKFSRGTVAVIGGSAKYSGAPALAASSALSSGAGFVSLLHPSGCEIRSMDKAIVKIALPSDGGVFCPASINPDIFSVLKKADALCVGPGMTASDSAASLVNLLWMGGKKAVFDADALNIIAAKKLGRRRIPGVMTPHDGEMKRLLRGYGIVSSGDRFADAERLASTTGCVVVLKGTRTLIVAPDGRKFLNMSGTNLLASAGTGDVLAGLVASLCAQGLDLFMAAVLGAYLHGRAAERNGAAPFSADRLLAGLSAKACLPVRQIPEGRTKKFPGRGRIAVDRGGLRAKPPYR